MPCHGSAMATNISTMSEKPLMTPSGCYPISPPLLVWELLEKFPGRHREARLWHRGQELAEYSRDPCAMHRREKSRTGLESFLLTTTQCLRRNRTIFSSPCFDAASSTLRYPDCCLSRSAVCSRRSWMVFFIALVRRSPCSPLQSAMCSAPFS